MGILAKNKNLNDSKGKEKIANMIKVASLTRRIYGRRYITVIVLELLCLS